MKKKVIYDIFDFYVDSFTVPSILRTWVKRLDYYVIHKVDGVIIVNESRQEQIEGSNPRRLTIIHNTPEDVSMTQIQAIHNTDSGILRLSYVGILQLYRSLFEIIDAVKESGCTSLELAGFGALEEEIRANIADCPRITFHGQVAYRDGLAISRRSDVLFAIYDPNIPNHKYSSPNKLYEAMMLGKPIIVAKGTGIDELVVKEDIGKVIDYENRDQLLSVLSELNHDSNLRDRLGRNARAVYETKYSWAKMEARLLNLYTEVLNEGS